MGVCVCACLFILNCVLNITWHACRFKIHLVEYFPFYISKYLHYKKLDTNNHFKDRTNAEYNTFTLKSNLTKHK